MVAESSILYRVAHAGFVARRQSGGYAERVTLGDEAEFRAQVRRGRERPSAIQAIADFSGGDVVYAKARLGASNKKEIGESR